ncbi:hypothetical protein OSSY52_12860 [Tepiditoga spiralis]|uniref:Oxaloacetate decarboxylase gamma chain n=1 Tax=Tepiditoga spiralis TaxID=2108365 RepID=A0A7G1G4W0_9BACT|nr:OadG family protein [Tepiditoga spiralis]BBE31145.1 hypothetical protein OSSY52_12860 [Tepiditoga spiralis]
MDKVWFITIAGILTVFIILVILMLVVSLLRHFSKTEKKGAKKEINLPSSAPSKVVNKVEINSNDENEEIAAIMGAISAFMGNKNYVVKSIKPAKKSVFSNSRWGTVNPTVTWRTR